MCRTSTRALSSETTRLGDCSFTAAGLRVWNSQPTYLQESDITLEQFQRALKNASLSDSVFLCAVYELAYLITYLHLQ